MNKRDSRSIILIKVLWGIIGGGLCCIIGVLSGAATGEVMLLVIITIIGTISGVLLGEAISSEKFPKIELESEPKPVVTKEPVPIIKLSTKTAVEKPITVESSIVSTTKTVIEEPIPAESYVEKDIWERYEIINEIGKGSIGTVYKARDKMHAQTVAIKKIKKEFSGRIKNKERLLEEA